MIWFITAFAFIGAILNIYKLWYGFLIWTITSAALATHNFVIGEHAQGVLWIMYCALDIWGLIKWKRKK